MRSTIRLWGALLATLALSAPLAAQGPAPVVAPKQAAAAPVPARPATPDGVHTLTADDANAWLDGMMPYALGTGDIAGANVVIVKDGQILTSRGFGYADVAKRSPIDPARTLMRPGSISKLFTWTAVMQQVEAGKLNLDADVNTYLDFKIPPRDGKPVTLRQIMTHSAGFEEAAKDIIFVDPKGLMPLGAYLKRWVPKRVFAPGTTPAYSNWATTLAGYVVERVSGEPFDTYIERHIFAPLGMRNATFRQPLPAGFAGHEATAYSQASEKPLAFELVGPFPAGSLSITGEDMARFMLAHLQGGAYGGGRILSPATTQLMHAPSPTTLPALNRIALGFFESNINGRRVIGHLGDTQGFHSALHLFPAEGVGIYLSVNSGGRQGAAGKVRTAFFTDFADRYFPKATTIKSIDAATAKAHAEMMRGTWANSRGSVSNFFAFAGLMGQTDVDVGPKGELVISAFKGEGGAVRRWVEVAPFLWADPDSHERLQAQVVHGKVVRFGMDTLAPVMVFDRVSFGRSSAWLMPAFLTALGVLAITFVLWPVRFFVRRQFGAALALPKDGLRAYRASRIMAGAIIAIWLGWMAVISAMVASAANLTDRMDPWLWLLQIGGAIAFVGGVGIMAWNLWSAWTTPRGWAGRIWAVALLLSAIVILWLAYSFGMIAMTVDY